MDVGELPGRNEDVLWQLQMIAGEAVEGLCCNLLGQIRPHKPVQDEVVCSLHGYGQIPVSSGQPGPDGAKPNCA
jgi:hypothetical protein